MVGALRITIFYTLSLTLVTAVFVSSAFASEKPTCMFLFGVCVSCTKSLTCEKYQKLVEKQLRPRRRPKPKARPKLRRTQPVGESVASRPVADLKQEFEQFKRFIQDEHNELHHKSDQELLQLYFHFKLWVAQRSNTATLPANSPHSKRE